MILDKAVKNIFLHVAKKIINRNKIFRLTGSKLGNSKLCQWWTNSFNRKRQNISAKLLKRKVVADKKNWWFYHFNPNLIDFLRNFQGIPYRVMFDHFLKKEWMQLQFLLRATGREFRLIQSGQHRNNIKGRLLVSREVARAIHQTETIRRDLPSFYWVFGLPFNDLRT